MGEASLSFVVLQNNKYGISLIKITAPQGPLFPSGVLEKA